MLIDVPNFCTVLRNSTDENVFYSKVSKLYQSLKILFFPKWLLRFCNFPPSSLDGTFSLNEIKSHINRIRLRDFSVLIISFPTKFIKI